MCAPVHTAEPGLLSRLTERSIACQYAFYRVTEGLGGLFPLPFCGTEYLELKDSNPDISRDVSRRTCLSTICSHHSWDERSSASLCGSLFL